MRQETIVKTYLKFDELNEKQKKSVLEKHRDINTDETWHENTFEDRETILKLLGFSGIQLSYSGFSSQGDGASFSGTFSVPKTKKELNERIKKAIEYAPNMKKLLKELTQVIFHKDELGDTLEIYKVGRYCHEMTMVCENKSLLNWARKFAINLYSDLEKEYDYLRSDEAIKETLEANDYEFDSNTLKIV